MLTTRKATYEDIISIAGRLREADLREINAVGHEDPASALAAGMHDHGVVFVGVDAEDVPHMIFGVGDSDVEGLGIVWMMASDTINDHWVQMLRSTHDWVNRLGHGYTALANMVHADNKLHIRWLKWAGFVFLRKIEVNDHFFYEFAKIIPKEVTDV